MKSSRRDDFNGTGHSAGKNFLLTKKMVYLPMVDTSDLYRARSKPAPKLTLFGFVARITNRALIHSSNETFCQLNLRGNLGISTQIPPSGRERWGGLLGRYRCPPPCPHATFPASSMLEAGPKPPQPPCLPACHPSLHPYFDFRSAECLRSAEQLGQGAGCQWLH